MEKVGIVILNYKLKKETERAIGSVFRSDYKNISVILVDNDSKDSVEDLIKVYPKIYFIQAGQNLGFSGGNNLGIKKALSMDCKFVFLLNPDAWVEKKAISSLVSVFKNDNVGIAGPKVYFADGKTILYAGGIFDKKNVLGSHRGVDTVDRNQFNNLEETDYVSGGAMMVKDQVFETIGLLDESYFLYYEDLDFCFRAVKAGFKIMYVPKSIAYHESGKSTGIGSPLQDYYITRNRMFFAKKHLSRRTQFALFREAIRNIKQPVRKKALIDFLLGKFGGPSI